MEPALALLCWLIALVVCMRVLRHHLPRGRAVTASSLAAIMTYGLSWFWHDAVSAWWRGDAALVAGPETAFLSMWALVAMPIARQRLDRSWMGEVVRDGLVATAAIGLSVDVTHLVIALVGMSAPGEAWAATVGMAVTSGLFFAGLALCLATSEYRFPWEYIAWFSGEVVMIGAVHPAFQPLDVAAGYGLAAVAGAFLTGYFLAVAASSRGARAYLGIGTAVLLPVVATTLYVYLGRAGR